MAVSGGSDQKAVFMSILGFFRTGFATSTLVLVLGLGACTTIEGTNALVDATTFERDVANETLIGLGFLTREGKPMIDTPRAPLVLPKDSSSLPQPKGEETASLLPEDSDKVQIDASNLTDEDMVRLRRARVVDLRALSGRPLTDAEARQLTALMRAANLSVRTKVSRPLYVPSDSYFTSVNGQDLICLADNGDLVPLDDPACPPEIRAALEIN